MVKIPKYYGYVGKNLNPAEIGGEEYQNQGEISSQSHKDGIKTAELTKTGHIGTTPGSNVFQNI